MLSWPGPDAALTMQSERTDPDVYLIDKAIELSVVAESASSRGQRSQQFHAGDPRLETRRRIATEVLREINWISETRGYVTCPGEKHHETRNADSDCWVNLDGVPNISCFHESCKEVQAEVSPIRLLACFGWAICLSRLLRVSSPEALLV
jgi:hypothetical protein